MTNVEKLKKLRVYGKFVRNMNAGRKKVGLKRPINVQAHINSKKSEFLVLCSFIWEQTPEGDDYWEDIYEKFSAL
jgi:hypothetical protein